MKARGEEIDPATHFDSNCITPGTPFMDRLGRHLRFFVSAPAPPDTHTCTHSCPDPPAGPAVRAPPSPPGAQCWALRHCQRACPGLLARPLSKPPPATNGRRPTSS
jgi:hypothetical protein